MTELPPDVSHRLPLIKHVLGTAIDHARLPEPFCSQAILELHDAVELFVQFIAEHVDVTLSKKADFLEYWPALTKQLDCAFPQQQTMKRLNQARVGLKHSGISCIPLFFFANSDPSIHPAFQEHLSERLAIESRSSGQLGRWPACQPLPKHECVRRFTVFGLQPAVIGRVRSPAAPSSDSIAIANALISNSRSGAGPGAKRASTTGPSRSAFLDVERLRYRINTGVGTVTLRCTTVRAHVSSHTMAARPPAVSELHPSARSQRAGARPPPSADLTLRCRSPLARAHSSRRCSRAQPTYWMRRSVPPSANSLPSPDPPRP